MKTYFAYIRVSTPRQGERGVSLTEQRDAILRYVTRQQLTISQWFEECQTAAKGGRPIWNQMLRFLRRSKATGVVIHKIDRSARNLRDWSDLGELIDQGIEVHFANEALDLQSRGGRLSADIQAVVAADFIRNLREEAKKGIYGRMKQGYYPLRAPLGYADNGAGKRKTIHPEKGPLVRRTFELYATGRHTIATLEAAVHSLGLRNHAGNRITRNGMSTILNNPFYMGLIRVRKTGETFIGNHDALIPKHLFETVQDVLRGRLGKRTQVHDFLFRRLIKCAHCGYALIGEVQKGHVYYRCHTEGCQTKGFREEYVASIVGSSLRRLEFTPGEKEYLQEAIQRLKGDWASHREQHLAMLRARRQQLLERLNRLTDVYLDQGIEKILFEERKTALLLERRAVEDELAAGGADAVPVALEKVLELAQAAYLLYEMAMPERKRRIIRIVSSNLRAGADHIDFPYSAPFHEVANRPRDTECSPYEGVARTCDKLLAALSRQDAACMKITASLEDDPDD